MQNPPKRRPAPLSVRMTPEQLELLDRIKGESSRNAFVIRQVFGPLAPRGRMPVKDHQVLSALIAKLGQSRVASSLNQLSQACHSGSLVLTPDIEAEIHEALSAVLEMRKMLLKALGLGDGGE